MCLPGTKISTGVLAGVTTGDRSSVCPRRREQGRDLHTHADIFGCWWTPDVWGVERKCLSHSVRQSYAHACPLSLTLLRKLLIHSIIYYHFP